MRLFISILFMSLNSHGASIAAAESLNWTDANARDFEAAIEKGDYLKVTSVMIMEGGELIYEGYFNGAAPATRHNTSSATKTINSMLIGAAIADGDIKDVDEPIVKFFRDKKPFANADKRKNAITIEDIMTMSSSLECDDWNSFSRGNEERMYLIEDMAQFYLDLPMRGFPVWLSPPEKRPYGRAFSYCTAGANLVGLIAGRAVDEDLEAYAQRRLFTPLGFDDVTWPRTGASDVMASGGLELTTTMLARLGQLFLNGGSWNGEQILPAAWIKESLQPRAKNDDTTEYGYLWWLSHYEIDGASHPVAYMSGNGGNRVIIMPDHELVVVVTKTNYNTRGMHETTQALFDDFIVNNIRKTP